MVARGALDVGLGPSQKRGERVGSRSEGKVLEVVIRGLGREPDEHPIGSRAEPSGSWLAKQGVEVGVLLQTRKMTREKCGPGVEARGEHSPHKLALGLGTLKFDCTVKLGLKTSTEVSR